MGRKINVALGTLGVLALGAGAYVVHNKAYNFRDGVYGLLSETKKAVENVEHKVDANTVYLQDLLGDIKPNSGAVADSVITDSLGVADSSASLENRVEDKTTIDARSNSTYYPNPITNTNTSESNPTITINLPGYTAPVAPSYSVTSDTTPSLMGTTNNTGKYHMHLKIGEAYIAPQQDISGSEVIINKDGIKVKNTR